MKIKLTDKLYNLITRKDQRISGRCKECDGLIFNLDSKWGRQGICIQCYNSLECLKYKVQARSYKKAVSKFCEGRIKDEISHYVEEEVKSWKLEGY